MRKRSPKLRIGLNGIVSVFASLAALLGIVILVWILTTVFIKGIGAIDWAFFTQTPAPPGEGGGGVANAILGTFQMILLAVLLGVPLGILTGIYLAEYGRNRMFGETIRFSINVLMGMPSIIIGLFIYMIVVVPMGHFSGYAGALALAIIMLPVIARTTEDMLQLVPGSLRESALALGASRRRVITGIVFRAARSGLITGCILGIARVSGETAPLLFTALNSPYWTSSLNGPTANLTVTIFNFAMSPYPDWQQIAWGASFFITFILLLTSIMARITFRERR